MDQLPVEIQEKILKIFFWNNNIQEIYRARVVSKTWKCIIDHLTSRLFRIWYSRCETEIPKDHLDDIVQAKYPLVAHPWQEFYWVDCGLAHVAKTAYEIWKTLPGIHDAEFCARPNITKTPDMQQNNPQNCVVGANDNYVAVSSRECDDGICGLWVYRWDNLEQHVKEYYLGTDILDKADFYSTQKETFVVLRYRTWEDLFETRISICPLDNRDLPINSTSITRYDEYFITQNEFFYIPEDGSGNSRILEH